MPDKILMHAVVRTMLLLLTSVLASCASLISSQTSGLANGLTAAVLDSEDLATVEQGAPAYLLLIDGLIESSPNNVSLLATGAQLNGAYAGAFVEDDARNKLLSSKALKYAQAAACQQNSVLCEAQAQAYEALQQAIAAETDTDLLYTLGVAWIGWLQAHSDDWNAIAQLPRAKLCMQRVVELDEGYQLGNAHLYLGGIATLLPPAMGGQPEVGKQHFERAIELSNGQNLLAKVLYASQYARLVFDQQLHDRLLTEVVSSSPQAEGLTLSNLVAQREAKKLLADSEEYF